VAAVYIVKKSIEETLFGGTMKARNILTETDRTYNISRNQELRISGTEEDMAEYLQVRSNGQITLPAATRRKAKLQEGDLLEALVEADGSIRLVPKTPVDRKLAEQYQLKDISWAMEKTKGSKK
jgi:AbrB family looped-hinge helix DNA binding protein